MLAQAREWLRRLSLANKCLILFGGAATLIIVIALSLPWLRMNALVGSGQLETSRTLVAAWFESNPEGATEGRIGGATIEVLDPSQARARGVSDPFVRRAIEAFEARPGELVERVMRDWEGWSLRYRYAAPRLGADGELTGVVLSERLSSGAGGLLAVNTLYVFAAGSVVLAVALIVFVLITKRLILEPVERLRDAAERVRDGDLETRAELHTGDEFEELGETFNLMLSSLEAKRDQLSSINDALDSKLSELAEANVALYEAARVKGDFLANVSHELRTPLNSIIGFAELLLEIARAESPGADEDAGSSRSLEKRRRYLENIVTAGRNLLELIESLLEMAKLEAGRIELRVEQVNVRDICQGLVGMIHPQATQKGVEVRLEESEDLPLITTDPRRLQQVVFNLLSNAVKFTASEEQPDRRREVIVRVEALREGAGVRVSVIDTGPGIAPEDQERVFDKFQQLDSGHTRGHTGAGLGLAIVREFVGVLHGELQLVSEIGRGSMFSVILPLELVPDEADQRDDQRERVRKAVAGRRDWV